MTNIVSGTMLALLYFANKKRFSPYNVFFCLRNNSEKFSTYSVFEKIEYTSRELTLTPTLFFKIGNQSNV